MATTKPVSADTSFKPDEKLRQEINKALGINPRKNIKRKLEESGVKFLGKGCYRITFKFTKNTSFSIENPTDYVLKVEYGVRTDGNKTEAEAFQTLPDKITENYLVPVRAVADDYRWLIMEYAEQDDIGASEKYELKENIQNDGFRYDDCTTRNMGKHDGRYKLLDYGHSWKNDDGETKVAI